MAKNIVSIGMNDSLRQLRITYEDNSVYYLTAKPRRKEYYAAAQFVALYQSNHHHGPIGEEDLKEFLKAQGREAAAIDRKRKQIPGIATTFSGFYRWWTEYFVDPASGYWLVTDIEHHKVDEQTASRVLDDVFQAEGSTAGEFRLGNNPGVKIIPDREGGAEIPSGSAVAPATPTGLTARLVEEAVRHASKTRAQVALSQSSLADERLYQSLQELYPQYPLLELYGKRRPVIVFPASPDEWHNLEAPLTPLSELDTTYSESDRARYGTEYAPLGRDKYDDLVARNRVAPEEVWNGRTYTMTRFSAKGDRRFQCGLGWYFDAVATCDVMESEILAAVQRQSTEQTARGNVGLDDLPIRKWLHDHVADPIVGGSFRSAAIACSTLILYRASAGGYRMLVNQRSSKVAAHPFQYHVAPSFMLGPVIDPLEEFSIRHNLMREYLEELYNLQEVRYSHEPGAPRPGISPRFFYGRRPLQKLMEMLSRTDPAKKADLLYTGIAVSLLNLRPEVCTLIIIRDKDWFLSESGESPSTGSNDMAILRFNEEFLTAEEEKMTTTILRSHPRSLMSMKLDERLEPVEKDHLNPENLVPPANAAISLGLDVARKILGIE